MSFTYKPDTDIGKVRRSIPDKEDDEYVWSDEEIQSMLNDEGDWRRATALALETIASDNAMVMQVIEINRIRTDGASVSRALLARAALLRSRAIEIESDNGDDFDIIDITYNDFDYRERLRQEALKEL